MTSAVPTRVVRVAAYCRKSHAQGLQQEFNSIHAQQQAIGAFVAAHSDAGWVLLDTDYSDGGFSGATIDRPGFQRLLADIAGRKVDCVVVYRIDRLSRSLVDYIGILQLFEKHCVTFASVSDPFNTTTPAGRLFLNQMMLFSQYERELIGERIRDKVRATRRRGAWTGGRPVLGYDVVEKKLVVNADEAQQLRAIYGVYVERGSIRETVEELRRRGWHNKTFTNQKKVVTQGGEFTKATLHKLLTNALYTGQIRAGTELVQGAQERLIPQELWDAVQQRLRGNGRDCGATTRNRAGALLRGLVRCGRCGSGMTHAFTTRGNKRHRYYVCQSLHDQGPTACPGSRVPAGKFEAFVADQIRVIGTDEGLLAKTADALERRAAEQQEHLDSELRRGERERQRLEADQQRGVNVTDQLRTLSTRLDEARSERLALDQATEPNLRAAFAAFTPVWEHLFPNERERILRLLIEQVTYDPDSGDASIDLRACGIAALAEEARTT